MATRAATFYPSTTDQDFSASGEGDIRKLVESIGGSDDTTVATFGTGTAEVILDPYTTRSTTGVTGAPNFGWAINRDGSDGMSVPTPPAGIDTAVRFVPSGNWTVSGRLGVGVATLAQVRMRVRLYRVSSSGSRSQLGSTAASSTVTPTVVGEDVSASVSLSAIEFAEDETVLVSIAIEKTNSGVGTNADVQFRLNDSSGNDFALILPGGIRTRYAETITVNGIGTASRQPNAVAVPRTVNAVGTATLSRTVTASRTITVDAIGTASRTLTVTPNPITVNAVGTVTGRIQLPIDELPGGGDFSGSDPTATVSGTVYDANGAPAVGVTVMLFRQSDNFYVASDTTDSQGAYSFTRDTADPNEYFTVAFSSDTAHGTSDRSNAPES